MEAIGMFRKILLTVALCTIAGCGTLGLSLDSGIAVTTTFNPNCPIVLPGFEQQCAPRAQSATVVVKSADGSTEVTRFTTGADGKFGQALAPGNYVLEPQPLSDGTRAPAQTVTVQAARFED